jgi:hypothetical protein
LIRDIYKNLVAKAEGKGPLERSPCSSRWEYNIKNEPTQIRKVKRGFGKDISGSEQSGHF